MSRDTHLRILLIGLLFISPGTRGGETVVGYVKTVTPHAVLIHNQRPEPLNIGSPVYAGATLKTDKKGTLGLTLKDDTVLSFGPDTEFEIAEFIYKPGDDRLKLSMRLFKGTLQYISGVIAKLKPDAIGLKTPSGIIGVRGTRFAVKVDD